MKSLNTTKNKNIYLTIKELSKKYSVKKLCIIAKVQRSSYYKWLNRKESVNEVFNQKLLKLIEKNYEESVETTTGESPSTPKDIASILNEIPSTPHAVSPDENPTTQIGRASCRERVCLYV